MESKSEVKKALSVENILFHVNYISTQPEEEETEDDFIYKYIIKIIFNLGPDKKINLKAEEKEDVLLSKFIELIYKLFKYNKKEREELYKTEITKINDKTINQLLDEIEEFSNFEVIIQNKRIEEIYKLIYFSLRKNNYSLTEYIESIILSLAFTNKFNELTKFQIYYVIIKAFLSPYNIKLNFTECEINIIDDISLDLIIYLFNKEKFDDELIILSIIILKFDSVKESIKECSISQILESINYTSIELSHKFTNNIIERVTSNFCAFCEQIINLKKNNNGKNKNKKKKIKKKKQIKKKCNPLKVNNIDRSQVENVNQNIESISENKKNKLNCENLVSKSEEEKINNNIIMRNELLTELINDYININNNNFGANNIEKYKESIKDIINKIINSKNMSEKQLSESLNDLKNIIIALLDSNYKLKEKVIKLEQDTKRLDKSLQENVEKLDELNEEIDYLKYENEEIKDVLSDIQCRDQAKNFIRAFKHYLTDKDYKDIRKDKTKKGKVISERLEDVFRKCKNKDNLALVQNLIKRACDTLNRGNASAHSLALTLENYEEDITNYKTKKKLTSLSSPEIFCFLLIVGISTDEFDESYDFLKKYFTKDLRLKQCDNKYSYENYFN